MTQEIVVRNYRKEDLPAVKWLVSQYLQRFYDDIGEGFPDSSTEVHEKNYDPFEYFTKAEYVWIAEIENKIVGMISVSIKCGNSIKISPVIIDETYREQRIDRKLIERLVQFINTAL